MAYVSRRVVAHFLIYIHLYFTKEMVVVKTHTINKQKKHNKQTQSKHDSYQFSEKHDY